MHNRTLQLTFIFLFLVTPVFAEKCYVYIDKIGIVEPGQEAGQNEYGDVIDIVPYALQNNPTRGELSRCKIIVLDLTEEDKQNLLAQDRKIIDAGTDHERCKIIRSRKNKIDIDKLKHIQQEQEVPKNEVLDKVIIKPKPTTDSE